MSDQTNQTRRDLLRAAAGVFSLAASGLFLPATREDAAAKSGALGGKHGGRHGPNRRGRNKAKRRRRQDRRQARDGRKPPKGSGTILDVLVYVHNRRSTGVTLRGWRMIDSEVIAWTPATDTITLPAKPASGPEPFHDFVFDVTHFAVAIGTSHIVEVGNRWIGYPWAVVGTGGWSQKGWDPKGQTLLDQGFLEGETATAPGFIVQRLNDSATHKRFLVNLV
ncbi:MAG: hypothetical protein KC442_20385 [Thermomicrobiales bacterium]|nr:hypothetical protein [Thermomicrobiales bacterium]